MISAFYLLPLSVMEYTQKKSSNTEIKSQIAPKSNNVPTTVDAVCLAIISIASWYIFLSLARYGYCFLLRYIDNFICLYYFIHYNFIPFDCFIYLVMIVVYFVCGSSNSNGNCCRCEIVCLLKCSVIHSFHRE